MHPSASACLGWYNLVTESCGAHRRINRRAVWKHSTHADRYLAFDGVAWLAQEKANLGRADGWLELFDAGCASPDKSAQVWNASDGKDGWPAQPSITCRRPTEAEVAAEAVAASLLAEEAAASARTAKKRAAKKAKKGNKKSGAAAAAADATETADADAAAVTDAAAATAGAASAGAADPWCARGAAAAAAAKDEAPSARAAPHEAPPALAAGRGSLDGIYSPSAGPVAGMVVRLHSLRGRPELNGRLVSRAIYRLHRYI